MQAQGRPPASKMPPRYLPPGSTLGIYGGGQLGRMTAMAARQMDYRTVTLDPDPTCPGAQVSDHHITAAYDDLSAVAELANRAQVITYEFENVDAAALESVSERAEILPSVSVLRVSQDRELEKSKMRELGIPVPNFAMASDAESASEAAHAVGFPAMMKTSRWGYDGKGQRVVESPEAAADAYEVLTGSNSDGRVIVEERLDFKHELSVVCARGRDGNIATFTPTLNVHRNGILDMSSIWTAADNAVAESATDIARRIALALDVIGLITVEMFLMPDGKVLVNELAPRPHNSGHLTIESCATSQFQQLVRIMAGLPLGDTTPLLASTMVNLLGDIWIDASDTGPNWRAATEIPGVNLHLYGKSEPRRARKMGHITAVAGDSAEAEARAEQSRARLG